MEVASETKSMPSSVLPRAAVVQRKPQEDSCAWGLPRGSEVPFRNDHGDLLNLDGVQTVK